ncbi:MAG: hypothetical protein DRN99_08305 [Thermoproteota archaeon]|nr:MAG: hypothetical protein DRN99_08305 [Candidatus Korarchaeota archaeon]
MLKPRRERNKASSIATRDLVELFSEDVYIGDVRNTALELEGREWWYNFIFLYLAGFTLIALIASRFNLATVFSSLSLACGVVFAAYATKLYAASLYFIARGLLGDKKLGSLRSGRSKLSTEHSPFVSVHIPVYNEPRVVDRILSACTKLTYRNYEVIVVDDSTDETTEILRKWAKHPRVKVIHRPWRFGFKGEALNEALDATDPRAEYIVVFDADFIPPPDIIESFLAYFKENSRTAPYPAELRPLLRRLRREASERPLVAVQGYQYHILNKDTNTVTRAVSTEYTAGYIVERTFDEKLGLFKYLLGSVFMIRADVLRRYRWSRSITEDWELSLRLYRDGYRIAFTPLIAAPAECPDTVDKLIRQRVRWAIGSTLNAKKYFMEILRSPHMTLREKLSFLYFAYYYMQAFLFLLGNVCWLIADLLLHTHPAFWSSKAGWILLAYNLVAAPLMESVGLWLENRLRRDFRGVLASFMLLLLLSPFIAYASLKGIMLGRDVRGWARTPKSGRITETRLKPIFKRLVYRLIYSEA